MANSFGNPIVIDTTMTQDAGLGRPLKVTSIAVVTATAGTLTVTDASSSTAPLYSQACPANPVPVAFDVPQVWKTFIVTIPVAGSKVYIHHK